MANLVERTGISIEEMDYKSDKPMVFKVEPSFDFVHQNKPESSKPPIIKIEVPGHLDISAYLDERLCLSPHTFYSLDGFEETVRKDVSTTRIIPLYFRIIHEIVEQLADLRGIYQINRPEIGEEFELPQNFVRITKRTGSNNLWAIDELFVPSSDWEFDQEVLDKFWARKYPDNVWADRYLGTDLRLFFVNPKEMDAFWELLGGLYCDSTRKETELRLKDSSDVVISNLIYGYRMRAKGIDEKGLNDILSGL